MFVKGRWRSRSSVRAAPAAGAFALQNSQSRLSLNLRVIDFVAPCLRERLKDAAL
jgi:hypothetical protein